MKMDKKISKIVLIAFIVIIAIAILDILSLNSGIFGTPESYTNGNFPAGWGSLFKNFVIILIVAVSLTYYILYRDKSEAIAIGAGSYIMWLTGVADVFYFWLQGKMIRSTLPWLDCHSYIGTVAKTLGFGGVTNISLIISAISGVIISYFIIKFLKEKL